MVSLVNNARIHHFVSQVEQKLNAIDPDLHKTDRKIYSFTIEECDKYRYFLDDSEGTLILTNLSDEKLYSFEIVDEKLSKNFEDFFWKYENDIEKYTLSLMSKIKCGNDFAEEIKNVVALKLLNTFRNPYCIKKTLNTIGILLDNVAVPERLKDDYEKIGSANKVITEKSKALADEYKVLIAEYNDWLKVLFLLLVVEEEGKEGSNVHDKLVERLFGDGSQPSIITVYHYTNKHVLLSDRGFVFSENESFSEWKFNLCASAFVSFTLCDVEHIARNECGYEEQAISQSLPLDFSPDQIPDDFAQLSRYNKGVIDFSFSRFFCKSKNVYIQ